MTEKRPTSTPVALRDLTGRQVPAGAGAWQRPPVDHGVVTHHEDQAASAASIDPLLFQEKF
ncbi:hypothetical protein ABT124_49550, partial [Streptomyces sp. NPDC001982]|uniref:hypothetical protein n=1 Tax=Streptomyces sp. NPDC001982 TaxID=3154405 RepID=UPI0033234AD6